MSEPIKRYTVGIAQYGCGPELREQRHGKMVFYADHEASIALLLKRIEELEGENRFLSAWLENAMTDEQRSRFIEDRKSVLKIAQVMADNPSMLTEIELRLKNEKAVDWTSPNPPEGK